MNESNCQEAQEETKKSRIAAALTSIGKAIVEHFAIFAVIITALYSAAVYWEVHYYLKQFQGAYLFAFGNFSDVFRISWYMGFSYRLFTAGILIIVFSFAAISFFAGSSKGSRTTKVLNILLAAVVSFFVFIFVYFLIDLIADTSRKKANAILSGKDIHYSLVYSNTKQNIRCVGLIGSTASHHLIWDYWREDIQFRAIPISSVLEPQIILLPTPNSLVEQSKDESTEDFEERRAKHKTAQETWNRRFNDYCPDNTNSAHPYSTPPHSAEVG